MGKVKQEPSSGRMIHIRISDETHRRLRIRAAELDTTIQAWVESLIENGLKPQRKGSGKS